VIVRRADLALDTVIANPAAVLRLQELRGGPLPADEGYPVPIRGRNFHELEPWEAIGQRDLWVEEMRKQEVWMFTHPSDPGGELDDWPARYAYRPIDHADAWEFRLLREIGRKMSEGWEL